MRLDVAVAVKNFYRNPGMWSKKITRIGSPDWNSRGLKPEYFPSSSIIHSRPDTKTLHTQKKKRCDILILYNSLAREIFWKKKNDQHFSTRGNLKKKSLKLIFYKKNSNSSTSHVNFLYTVYYILERLDLVALRTFKISGIRNELQSHFKKWMFVKKWGFPHSHDSNTHARNLTKTSLPQLKQSVMSWHGKTMKR